MEYTAPLERSASANYAKHIFYHHINDISIFIEDTEQVVSKVFLTLLQPHLGNIRLEKIFPLGGRTAVIEKAKQETNKKNIFIVDGDLYLLCGEYRPLPDNVIRLEKYSIENYLITDIDTIYSYVDSNITSHDKPSIIDKLDIESWLNQQAEFEELYYLFALSHKCQSGIITTGRNFCNFTTNFKDFYPCSNKIQEIYSSVKSDLITKGKFKDNDDLELSLKEMKESFSNSFDAIKYINGKLLIQLLFNLIQDKFSKFRFTKDVAKNQLAKHCPCYVFEPIANLIKIQFEYHSKP